MNYFVDVEMNYYNRKVYIKIK